MEPRDRHYGYRRGLPVDRYYIEEFLTEVREAIRGEVLEVKQDLYATRFGGSRVGSVEIVDIDASNRHATIVGDILDPATLERGRYDCVILTQTLYLLSDANAGLANLWGSLRPGGTLVLSDPLLCPVDELQPGDRGRMTPRGLELLFGRLSPAPRELAVTSYGNLVATTAFLHGLAAEELTQEELGHRDARYPVVVTAMARKSAT